MSEKIRIVENQVFDKHTADIIAQSETEAKKLVTLGKDKYAYCQYIKVEKLEGEGYQYTVTTPDGKSTKCLPVKHPYVFPKKVFYFNNKGQMESNSFIALNGQEVKVSREYHTFLKFLPKHKQVLLSCPQEVKGVKRGGYYLSIFLEEVNLSKPEYNEASEFFFSYLFDYSYFGEDTLFDNDKLRDSDYEGFFANDLFYQSVIDEERRRWMEAAYQYKNEKREVIEQLDATKTYLKHLALIDEARKNSLNIEQ